MTAPADRIEIDARDAAALVIEFQNDLVHESKASQKGVSGGLARAVRDRGVVARMRRVLAAARAASVPVLYATIENVPGLPKPDLAIYRWSRSGQILRPGTWGAEVHPEVRPEPGDFVVNRSVSIDPSYGSALWATLRALGRRTILAMGVSTNFAVEGTARAAANRMFQTVVVEDCCASVPDEWHRFSVENVLPLIATVATAEAVIAALKASSPA